MELVEVTVYYLEMLAPWQRSVPVQRAVKFVGNLPAK